MTNGEQVTLKSHLGNNVFVQVQSPFVGVNIRQWFQPKEGGDLRPGKGLFLNVSQWNEVCKADDCPDDFVPDLKDTIRCSDQTDHCNQLGFISCLECNPNREYVEYLLLNSTARQFKYSSG